MNKRKFINFTILSLLSLVSVGFYLIMSARQYKIGFPLDDAWIHQTYARNIASGEWAFIPGEVSGGTTSPLWSLILSVAYLLKIPPLPWTFGINLLVLCLLSFVVEDFFREESPSYNSKFPWVGTLFIFEWHLVWSAASGMETLLFSGIVLTFFTELLKQKSNFWFLGLLIGISLWFRPEGITLIGPIFLVLLLVQRTFRSKTTDLIKVILPLGFLLILYSVLFYHLTGSILPTTFFAKQAEYQSLTSLPYLRRFGFLGVQLLVGSTIVLLPGLYFSFRGLKMKQRLGIISAVLWILGIILIYAWKLPVIYQHGRYMIPCITVLIFISLFGVQKYLEIKKSSFSIIKISWILSLVAVTAYFWISGAVAYGKDVRFIEQQMVETAIWVRNNVPSGEVIATHDIGAMGYFDDHPLIDLAGLVTPDIIPIIADEEKLAEYLNTKKVSYIILFPNWYPRLTSELKVVHSGPEGDSLEKTMNVYLWENH